MIKTVNKNSMYFRLFIVNSIRSKQRPKRLKLMLKIKSTEKTRLSSANNKHKNTKTLKKTE